MRRILVPLGALVLLSCSDSNEPVNAPVEVTGPDMADSRGHHQGHHFRKPRIVGLSGEQEVPARETRARGLATFRFSKDGKTIFYTLRVARISNVFQGHIHIGAVGANGPIAVWLYPSTAPTPGPLGGGPIRGLIAKGSFTSENLTAASGAWDGTFESLVEALRTGGAYVNVHTNDGIDPPNTGPGDFPGGEIRGQFRDKTAPHSKYQDER